MRVFLRLLRGDISFLLLSLFLSVWVVVAFSAFTERLQVMLLGESSQLLAADAVLKSPYLLPDELLDKAADFNLRSSRYASFQSMVFADGEPQLVNVKAVDEGYPLLGQLEIETSEGKFKQQAGARQGKIWAEKRLFSLLELQLGQVLEMGAAELELAAVLIHQPDQGLNLFSVGSRVLIHWDDIGKTELIQEASKVSYSYLFAGDASNIKQYQEAIKEQLTDSQEWLDLQSSQPTVANIVHSAQLFFLLASGAIVILASIAMAMAAKRFADVHQSQVAVLKSFGLSASKITQYYSFGLLLYSLPVYLLACVLAYFSQDFVLQLLAKQMDVSLPTLSVWPFMLGFLTLLISFVALIGPSLWRLKNSSSLSVLRQTTANNGMGYKSHGFAVVALFCLLWIYSQAFLLTALLFIALFLVFLALYAVFYGILHGLLKQPRTINHWRSLAVHQLKRYLPQHASQAAVFSVSLMLLVLIVGMQDNLFQEWKKQLPDDAPNAFLVNVYPEELSDITQWLEQKNIATETLYPMVRGRLVKINQQAVSELFTKEQQKKASIDRELNLSWKHALAADNKIEQGDWQTEGISIEQQMAERLNIELGDNLSFRIEGREVSAVVTSIRSVDWNSMRPNFFVLMEEGDLSQFASTYMTSLRIDAEQKLAMTEFMQRWPTAILIEIDSLIEQVRSIVAYVALALKVVLVFIVLASLLVLLLSVRNSFAQRSQENALLRVFGANKALLQKSLLAEFALLGLIAGLVAAVVAQIALLALQVQVFKLPWQVFWSLLPIAPLLGVLVIGAAGYLAVRRIVLSPPKRLLLQ